MKIPKKIKIGGLTYVIEKGQDMKDKDGDSVDGRCHIESQKIEFEFYTKSNQEYKELIFWHELTHLLFYYSGIGEHKSWD